MNVEPTKKVLYGKKEICADYDRGYSIKGMVERYIKSSFENFKKKVTNGQAEKFVRETIYDYIIARKSI